MNAQEFYDANKHLQWRMPAAPKGCITDYEIADWLLNKSDFGWLEIDLKFDLAQWIKEIHQITPWLVAHRESDSQGWNSCCIHGIDIDKTGAWTRYGYSKESDVPYRWTTLADYAPYITEFWKKFPYERYRRIRLMEVIPGGYIDPHSDMPGRLPGEDNFDALEFGVPINVAIVHPQDCHMTLGGYGTVPWTEGKLLLINIRNYHSVINLSSISRYHLIAHGIPGSRKQEFVELIARSYRKQYAREK